MKYALVLTLLVAGAVHAQEEPVAAPPLHWTLEQVTRGVPDDGRHIGLSWTRDHGGAGTVVIFRRVAPPGSAPGDKASHVHVVDRVAQIVPMFMYPETYKAQYYPAFDATQHPIRPGTRLGVWTVVDSVDGDRSLWIDEVEPGPLYIYALVPAQRAAAPDTYERFDNSAIATPPLAPFPPALWQRRWFQALAAVVIVGILGAVIAVVKRRRRAGAGPSGEASSSA